jgi:hypothetical protein
MTRPATVAALVFSATLLAGAPEPARADATAYHLQIAGIDALADGLLLGGVALESMDVALIGGGIAVFGAPILHGLHDAGNAAGMSVILRLLSIAVPLLLFDCADAEGEDENAVCGYIAFGSLVAVQLIDSLFITPYGIDEERIADTTMMLTVPL